MLNELKTGKKPATYSSKDLQLAHFEQAGITLNKAPVGFGDNYTDPSWGMLGNDTVGDCGWAGAAHETMRLTQIAELPATFDTSHVIGDYSACTGYNPNDPDTDQGTGMTKEMSYRRHTGIMDSNGKRHQIGAYMHLEPGNWTQLLEALWAFNVIGIGIEFPQSAMDQFNAGRNWTVVKGSPVEGGHYIPVVGHPTTTYVDIVTWGKKIRMNESFYKKYNDESYAFVSVEDLVNNISPQGYNLTELSTILGEL